MHEAAGYKVVYSKQKYLQTYHHIFIEKRDRPPTQAQQRASFFRLPISFVPRYASCGRLPMSSTLEWQFATPSHVFSKTWPYVQTQRLTAPSSPIYMILARSTRPNTIRPVRPSSNAALATAFGLLDSWHGFLKRLSLASILISLVRAFVFRVIVQTILQGVHVPLSKGQEVIACQHAKFDVGQRPDRLLACHHPNLALSQWDASMVENMLT